MDVRLIDRPMVDASAWAALARGGSFFQTLAWADVCAAGIGPQARSVFLCGFEGDGLWAGLPAVITRRLGQRSFFSMPYGTYGGILFAPEVGAERRREFVLRLNDFLRAERFAQVEITDFEGSLAGGSAYPLVRVALSTHVIPLSAEAEYHPPDKKIEGHLRTGRKTGAEIVAVEQDTLDDFYELYRRTEVRHGRKKPRYHRRMFEQVWRLLSGTGMLYWNGLLVEGRLAGSQISFIFGETLFSWQTVSDYDLRQYKPNHLLLDDAIRYGLGRGVRRVNLGGSPEGAAGLREYKERWGGQAVMYDAYSYRSRWHRLVRR